MKNYRTGSSSLLDATAVHTYAPPQRDRDCRMNDSRPERPLKSLVTLSPALVPKLPEPPPPPPCSHQALQRYNGKEGGVGRMASENLNANATMTSCATYGKLCSVSQPLRAPLVAQMGVCLQCGNLGSIPGSGSSPGEGNGNLLQYSCLENSVERGAWRASVHGVAKSQTRLGDLTLSLYSL